MSEKDEKKSGMNRRDFLRNSAYAAYATPIVLSMLVNKANATQSWNPGCGEQNKTGRRPKNAPVGRKSGRSKKNNNPN
jgi:hypothetical protein